MIGEKAMNIYRILFLSSLLTIAVFEAGGQDRGELSLEPVPANIWNIDLCAQYIENYARKKILNIVSAQQKEDISGSSLKEIFLVRR